MSAWDSKKTTVIHKFLHNRYAELNEAMKTCKMSMMKNNSVMRHSDIPLDKLVEIDPDVIGNGEFRIFSKQYKNKKTNISLFSEILQCHHNQRIVTILLELFAQIDPKKENR